MWPGVFAGAFLANLFTAGTPLTSAGIAAGNTLEAVLGVHLVNRFAGGRGVFTRPQDVFKFVVLAGLVSTAVSATAGVTSVSLGGWAEWSDYGRIWLTWWLGDAAGDLIVAPFVVLWWLNPRLQWSGKRAFEALLLAAALASAGGAVFGGLANHYPLEFLCLPPLLWSAFRFGPRETASAVFLLSLIAIRGTLRGHGPFVSGSPNESLLLLQAFMAVVSVSKLMIATAVQERRSALRQSKEWARLIIETAYDAFIEIDSAGNVTHWNRQAETTFGWRRQDAVGKSLAELIIPPSLREAHRTGLQKFLETGEGPIFRKRIELSALRRDGTEFAVELVVWPIQRGEVCSFNAFVHDIGERKRAKEALQRAHDELERRVEERTRQLKEANEKLTQSDRMKSDFIMAASHELRTPLTSIQGYISLIQGEKAGQVNESQRNFLGRVQKATNRLHRLVNELLSISRIESGQTPPGLPAGRDRRAPQGGHRLVPGGSRRKGDLPPAASGGRDRDRRMRPRPGPRDRRKSPLERLQIHPPGRARPGLGRAAREERRNPRGGHGDRH
jgi:PAS domain S-box-containing protein